MTVVVGVLLILAYDQRSEISFLRSQIGPTFLEGTSIPTLDSTLGESPFWLSLPPGEPHVWTLLTFLRADCMHCHNSIGALNEAARHHSGIRVVGVAVDSISVWEGRSQVGDLSFPLIEIPQSALTGFRIRQVPSTFLIDEKGVIRRVLVGSLESDRLEALLQSQVSALPVGESTDKAGL